MSKPPERRHIKKKVRPHDVEPRVPPLIPTAALEKAANPITQKGLLHLCEARIRQNDASGNPTYVSCKSSNDVQQLYNNTKIGKGDNKLACQKCRQESKEMYEEYKKLVNINRSIFNSKILLGCGRNDDKRIITKLKLKELPDLNILNTLTVAQLNAIINEYEQREIRLNQERTIRAEYHELYGTKGKEGKGHQGMVQKLQRNIKACKIGKDRVRRELTTRAIPVIISTPSPKVQRKQGTENRLVGDKEEEKKKDTVRRSPRSSTKDTDTKDRSPPRTGNKNYSLANDPRYQAYDLSVYGDVDPLFEEQYGRHEKEYISRVRPKRSQSPEPQRYQKESKTNKKKENYLPSSSYHHSYDTRQSRSRSRSREKERH